MEVVGQMRIDLEISAKISDLVFEIVAPKPFTFLSDKAFDEPIEMPSHCIILRIDADPQTHSRAVGPTLIKTDADLFGEPPLLRVIRIRHQYKVVVGCMIPDK